MSEKPEAQKLSHAVVGYVAESVRPGEQCSGCTHFIAAAPARCEGVKSPIDPPGWCRHYADRDALQELGFAS